MKHFDLGLCIFDPSALSSLTTLWEGEIKPYQLATIEKAVGCILLYNQLAISKFDALSGVEYREYTPDTKGFVSSRHQTSPLAGYGLDYLFKDSDFIHAADELPGEQSSVLEKMVQNLFNQKLVEQMPSDLKYSWQYYRYLDLWYEGLPNEVVYIEARDESKPEWWDSILLDDELPDRISKSDFLEAGIHPVFHNVPLDGAKYLAACHRAGHGVCSTSRLANCAHDFLFAVWPQKLLAKLEKDHAVEARAILPPAHAFPLPPLTSLLLSRAKTRLGIPDALTELYHEFTPARTELWKTLHQLWFANTNAESLQVLEQLELAADAIYRSAFPKKMSRSGYLALAVETVTFNVSDAANRLLDRDRVHAQVGAISFARQLSAQLNKHLLTTRALVQHHFTASERAAFGID